VRGIDQSRKIDQRGAYNAGDWSIFQIGQRVATAMLGPAKKTGVEVYEGGEKTFNAEIRAGAEML
jgi:hypothetical protein